MPSKIMTVIQAGLLTSLASVLLLSQAPTVGILAGTVYDQAGARLEHSIITIKDTGSGVEHSAHPNERGDYRFENLPAGKYSVRASAIGLTSVQINDVVVQMNKTSAVNVTLPIAKATPVTVVQVSEAPQPVPFLTAPTEPAPMTPAHDSAKAIANEIGNMRDRLALSAAQLIKVRTIFEDREGQIENVRSDESLTMRVRREQVRTIREESDARFRAVLNENQIDEYEEILRERRERALRRQEVLQASH